MAEPSSEHYRLATVRSAD